MRDGQTVRNRGRSNHGAPRSRILPILAVLLLLIGGGYIGMRLMAPHIFPAAITDAAKYGTILKDWSASSLASHFPPAVPAQATHVRFSAFPGFLQGGAHIQLRMQLPPEEIGRLEEQLKAAAVRIFPAGQSRDTGGRPAHDDLPWTSFHTADDPSTAPDFPLQYSIYLLHSRDRAQGSWNHGETSGAAISTPANEVIYWAERW